MKKHKKQEFDKLNFYPPETIDDFMAVYDYGEEHHADLVYDSLIGHTITAKLSSTRYTGYNVKVTGEIVGTHFNVGGLRAINVSVKNKSDIYNDKLGIVGLGVHLIDLRNVISVENNK